MRGRRVSRTERSPDRREGAVAFSVWIYGLLIRAYPEGLRGEYGDEMVRSFRDLCRREIRGQGAWGLALLWVRVLPDLVLTALKERSIMLARNAYLPVPPVVAMRWGALSALLGGASGAALYLVAMPVPEPLRFVGLVLSAALCALGLLGLYGALAAPSGTPGRLASAGGALAAASVVSWLALGAFGALGLAWGWATVPTLVAAATAVICWFLALLLLGAATLRARFPGYLRALPLTMAALCPVGLVLSVLLYRIGYSPPFHSLLFLGSALLGLALLRSRDEAVDIAPSGAASVEPRRLVVGRSTTRSPVPAMEVAKEKELLDALRRRGALTVAGAALETSLSVDEADRMLSALAAKGHLDVRVEHGRLLYSLWPADEQPKLTE